MTQPKYPTVFIQSVLDGAVSVPVSVQIPNKRPKTFVVVDASPPQLFSAGVARRCEIIVQAYGPNDAACVDVLGECETVLNEALPQDDTVLSWQQSTSIYEFPDSVRPELRRWQFTGSFIQSALG